MTNNVLLFLSLLLLFNKITIILNNLLVESCLREFKVIDLGLFGINLFLEFVELSNQLGDLIVLSKGKTTAIFDNLV